MEQYKAIGPEFVEDVCMWMIMLLVVTTEICERKQKLQGTFQAGVSLSENGIQMKNPLQRKSMTNHPMRREKFWVQFGILVKIY